MKKIVLALSLCVSFLAQAKGPVTKPPHVVVLKAARLFDGTSDNVVTNAVVIVEDNRIKSIGGAIPAGAEVIDLGDATLLPGFIDAHVHLTSESGDNFYLQYFQDLMRHPAEQALLASTYARKTIDAGFTTVRNLGAGDYVDVGLR